MKLLQEFKNRLQKNLSEQQEESFNEEFYNDQELDTTTERNEDDMFLFI